MSVTIQIRNVPDALHRRLKARAKAAGLSLSSYLLRELRQVAEQPTLREMRARLRRLPPIEADLDPSPAALIRMHRDGG